MNFAITVAEDPRVVVQGLLFVQPPPFKLLDVMPFVGAAVSVRTVPLGNESWQVPVQISLPGDTVTFPVPPLTRA
jgi:hypothetical protein